MKTFRTYQEARGSFEDGDIVFFSNGKKNIIRRLITWFTNGPRYHVGIAFWADISGERRLLIGESQPDGFRIINLGFYADRTIEVFRCPVAWKSIKAEVLNAAGPIKYDFVDLIMIGLHEKFGIKIQESLSGEGDVCSAFIAQALSRAGFVVEKFVSPERLFNEIKGRMPLAFAKE